MPAFLPSPKFLPVTLPPLDYSHRVRPVPRELIPYAALPRDRQATPFEKAMVKLIEDLYHPPGDWFRDLEERDRRLGEAINPTAEAAFCPITTIAYNTADETADSDTWNPIGDLAQEIVVAIPARIHLLLALDVETVVSSGEDFESHIVATGGSIAGDYALAFSKAIGANFRWPVVSQALIDLEPEILYTFTPEIRTSATGLSEYTVRGTSSNSTSFSTRVEARSLSPFE